MFTTGIVAVALLASPAAVIIPPTYLGVPVLHVVQAAPPPPVFVEGGRPSGLYRFEVQPQS